MSTSRSRGISFSVILQNLDQLEAVYEKSYETIMGNCDTHVFLGSNSFKTVEYFSKALGEKTVFRDSKSINRDKHYHKQGLSGSDQSVAKALMTPDELRRMDNDLCIIFEKGLKPVKARKYYYFEKPIARKLQEHTLNHLEFDVGVRGKWRKYNPYNPYVEENDKNQQQKDLKVESLDDLFEDVPNDTKTHKTQEKISGDKKLIENTNEMDNLIDNNVQSNNTSEID
ncbi:MAG: TraM recognition domain-containing protein [Clostridia bacterium]